MRTTLLPAFRWACGPTATRETRRSSSSSGVLALIIFEVLAVLDRAPPVLAVLVPLDRLLNGGMEAVLGLPAEFAFDLAGVDGVPPIVARAIFDVLHAVVPVAAHLAQDRVDDRAVGHLVIAADVVDLARLALVEHRPDRLTMVFDVQPVADVQAVAVERNL